MLNDDRDSALMRGDALWKQLCAALDAHPEDEPIGPATDWSGRDVYAHFGRWQEVSLATARDLLAGRRPARAKEDEDSLNNRWRDEDRSLSSEAVRERCHRTRAELRDLLMSISAEQWTRWGNQVAADISGEHYEHHLAAAESRPV